MVVLLVYCLFNLFILQSNGSAHALSEARKVKNSLFDRKQSDENYESYQTDLKYKQENPQEIIAQDEDHYNDIEKKYNSDNLYTRDDPSLYRMPLKKVDSVNDNGFIEKQKRSSPQDNLFSDKFQRMAQPSGQQGILRVHEEPRTKKYIFPTPQNAMIPDTADDDSAIKYSHDYDEMQNVLDQMSLTYNGTANDISNMKKRETEDEDLEGPDNDIKVVKKDLTYKMKNVDFSDYLNGIAGLREFEETNDLDNGIKSEIKREVTLKENDVKSGVSDDNDSEFNIDSMTDEEISDALNALTSGEKIMFDKLIAEDEENMKLVEKRNAEDIQFDLFRNEHLPSISDDKWLVAKPDQDAPMEPKSAGFTDFTNTNSAIVDNSDHNELGKKLEEKETDENKDLKENDKDNEDSGEIYINDPDSEEAIINSKVKQEEDSNKRDTKQSTGEDFLGLDNDRYKRQNNLTNNNEKEAENVLNNIETGNLKVSGNRSPLALGEVKPDPVLKRNARSNQPMNKEESLYVKRIERQIQAKIDAIRERMKKSTNNGYGLKQEYLNNGQDSKLSAQDQILDAKKEDFKRASKSKNPIDIAAEVLAYDPAGSLSDNVDQPVIKYDNYGELDSGDMALDSNIQKLDNYFSRNRREAILPQIYGYMTPHKYLPNLLRKKRDLSYTSENENEDEVKNEPDNIEYLKALEESFPNPQSQPDEDSLAPHIRVKRGTKKKLNLQYIDVLNTLTNKNI